MMNFFGGGPPKPKDSDITNLTDLGFTKDQAL